MKPLRIFFLEDDRQLVDLLDIRLKRIGYQVCGYASEADKAINLLKTCSPDLALLDIEIRGRPDGISVGQYLLNNTDVPFVYITGHDDEKVLGLARKTMPDGFLLKPFDERQLRVAVEMGLRR